MVSPLRLSGCKVARLPNSGTLLVCTDLQGNLDDYHRMKTLYLREEAAGHDPILLFCGDLVHGPDRAFLEAHGWPEHLGERYEDHSPQLLRDLMVFSRQARVCCLLGNHEHAHIGGPVVAKFHPDEAADLEARIHRDRAKIHAFMRAMPLLAVADCGAVFCHAAPAGSEKEASSYEALQYEGYEEHTIEEMHQSGTVGQLLWARFAREAQAQTLLRSLLPALDGQGMVTFGHDVVEEGFERVGQHQLCLSTSYGVARKAKTYLRLDLAQPLLNANALRVGEHLLPLYDT